MQLLDFLDLSPLVCTTVLAPIVTGSAYNEVQNTADNYYCTVSQLAPLKIGLLYFLHGAVAYS